MTLEESIHKVSKFEEFLYHFHADTYPHILDDKLPDAFEKWMEKLNQDELIVLADRAIEHYVQEDKDRLSIVKPIK